MLAIERGSSLLCASFLCLLTAVTLAAQNPTATLVGSVTDPTGSVVVGAKVEVRNSGTNEVRKRETDQRGEFTVPSLAPGIYDVSIAKDGFRTLHETGLELQLAQQARVGYYLQLGSLAEKVEVTASVPLVNTENGSKGDVMVSQEMLEMPLDGRDFSNLAFLMPNVLPTQFVSGGGFQSAFATNGQRGDNVNFVIDGSTNRSPRDGTAQARPNLDALQEFKMETTGYSAEAGRTSGGLITMVLKSGTNQLHGGLFEFLRNDKMDARNFFATSKTELRRNQFGGTASGPVFIPKLYDGRNHTFFLFSWESYRQVQGTPGLATVPTAAIRQGDFSAFAPVKDPLAPGTFFAGNQIPLSRMSPTALAIQTFWPLPNYPGASNYYNATPTPNNWNSVIAKIDEVVTSRDSLSFKYLRRSTGSKFTIINGVAYVPAFGNVLQDDETMAGLTYTRMLTPALINEARFSFSRTANAQRSFVQGTDYNKQLGLPGPTDPTLLGFPNIGVTNYVPMDVSAGIPALFWVNNYGTSDTLTWVKGPHLMKFGGDILYSQFSQIFDQNVRGTYQFTGSWTGQPYADFLLGLLNSDSILHGTVKSYVFMTNPSFFFQDGWKITPRLTLNLGLRYELPGPPYDKYGRWASFVPELGKLLLASDRTLQGTGIGFANASSVETAQQAGLPFSLMYRSYRKFAPRFGFAWRPFGGNRTVLRGGYGVFYGTYETNDVRRYLAGAFPWVINVNNNRNPNDPTYLTLADPFPVTPSLVQNVVSVSGVQLSAPNPYSQSWNLTVEREIGRAAAIEIAYIGARGAHLSHSSNINQPFRSATTYPNFPVPYPAWSTISYIGFDLNSIYNAANFTFRRRFANNFFYRASYVFGKSIDEGSVFLGATPQDPRNMRLERGRSDFDVGHSFTMAFSWQAPKRYNILLRGWQLAGTGIARTGFPFTPAVNNVNLALGEASRPNRIAKGTVPNPSPQRWYDASAFPPVPTGSYTFGTSGRNILDAPGSVTFNLSFSRNFTVREGHNLQFRWEAFNFVNHTTFRLPVATVNTPNAGTILSAAAARSMQVALRYSF